MNRGYFTSRIKGRIKERNLGLKKFSRSFTKNKDHTLVENNQRNRRSRKKESSQKKYGVHFFHREHFQAGSNLEVAYLNFGTKEDF